MSINLQNVQPMDLTRFKYDVLVEQLPVGYVDDDVNFAFGDVPQDKQDKLTPSQLHPLLHVCVKTSHPRTTPQRGVQGGAAVLTQLNACPVSRVLYTLNE